VELRRQISQVQKLDISPEEKARRMQGLMMQRHTPQVVAEEEKEEEEEDFDENADVCRYCLSAGGELISPCKCMGGQKYCHLKCLHEWQRKAHSTYCITSHHCGIPTINYFLIWKVLITQSPNPRFHTDDTRHEVQHLPLQL